MKDFIEELKAEGWQGFKTIAQLKSSVSEIPKTMGVYMVLRFSTEVPHYINPGTGGFFKGKDPNVPIEELQAEWNANSPIMYIGKAGSSDKKATLNSRLSQYIKFGCGSKIGHWGGRYIWQLRDADQLVVCWLPTTKEPEGVEFLLLREFQLHHGGKLPFANINRGCDLNISYEIKPALLKLLHI